MHRFFQVGRPTKVFEIETTFYLSLRLFAQLRKNASYQEDTQCHHRL